MTPAQKDTFISILTNGWMCGLKHPFECYQNAQQMLEHYTPFAQFTTKAREIDDAFLAFLNEARVPGQPEWTLPLLAAAVGLHYEKK